MSITDRAAKSLMQGETHSERIAGRGAGTLLFLGRGRSVSLYYRYTAPDGSRPWIDLGGLGKDTTLSEARARCAELAALKKQHPDLKGWLESQKLKEQETLLQESQERQQAASKATFRNLLDDYLANMRSHRQVSEKTVSNVFTNEVIEVWPALVEQKARDIEPQDISRILKPISGRNALVYRNRVRSYLHAAFEFALRHEFDETRESGKIYGLKNNPVAVIPFLRQAEKVGERALTDAELRQLFNNLHKVDNVSERMADFIRFLILIGGQRPAQVLRAKWADYDLKQKTLLIRDLKGKRKDAMGKAHLIPLPDAAIAILEKLVDQTGQYEWPFTTAGKVPFSLGSLKNVFTRFLGSEYARIDEKRIDHFTARDLRRTCKQIMIRASIRRDLRNLLQGHAQSGVDVVNYGNDPSAYLPEKIEAMTLYSAALKAIFSIF